MPSKNLDLDSHVVERNLGIHNAGDADGVFFCGEYRIELHPRAAANKALDFLHGIPVVVGVGLSEMQVGTE